MWSTTTRTFRQIEPDVWVCVTDLVAVMPAPNDGTRLMLRGGHELVVSLSVEGVLEALGWEVS